MDGICLLASHDNISPEKELFLTHFCDTLTVRHLWPGLSMEEEEEEEEEEEIP